MSGAEDRPRWEPLTEAEYRQEAQVRLGAELAARFGHVKLMVFDADGVLTAGALVYGPQGEALKAFHARDGLGLALARTVGIKRAVLTGRNSMIVERRTSELRFDAIELGRFDKVAAFAEILEATGCTAEETLYMGDDLIDLPAMSAAGLAVAVPGAVDEVKEFADYVTAAAGGAGAVREVTDLVLKSAGLYALALTRLQDKAWQPTKQELSSDAPGTPGARKDGER